MGKTAIGTNKARAILNYFILKTQIRLNSVVLHGVGSSPETGAIELIYSFLLTEFQQDIYKYISINQIGNDLKEFVIKEPGNKIHVNIKYPLDDDFEMKSLDEKNMIRLDVIHNSLLRVAHQFGKLEIQKLEEIKQKIISFNFSFDFVYRIYEHKKNHNLIAKIVIHPESNRFNYFLLVEDNQKVKCRIKLYSGLTNLFYYPDLFSNVKWKSINEILIIGKVKEVEIYIKVNECKIVFRNLTNYLKSPFFEMMRADTSEADRQKAHKDWLHSLPASQSALLNYKPN